MQLIDCATTPGHLVSVFKYFNSNSINFSSKLTKWDPLINYFQQFIYINFIIDQNMTSKQNWISNFKFSRLPSGAHFPSVMTVFKTALVSIIFILELSVLDKSCLELNFQAKWIISRVPCTPVFLRSHTSSFQYWIF